MEIDVLEILDQMDEIRRHQQKSNNPDLCMRMLEAVLARAAGYEGRHEWTQKLKEIPTRYSRDLKNTENIGLF